MIYGYQECVKEQEPPHTTVPVRSTEQCNECRIALTLTALSAEIAR